MMIFSIACLAREYNMIRHPKQISEKQFIFVLNNMLYFFVHRCEKRFFVFITNNLRGHALETLYIKVVQTFFVIGILAYTCDVV